MPPCKVAVVSGNGRIGRRLALKRWTGGNSRGGDLCREPMAAAVEGHGGRSDTSCLWQRWASVIHRADDKELGQRGQHLAAIRDVWPEGGNSDCRFSQH